MGGYAWVTLATNDSYSLGALVLAHSLRGVRTKHDLAVLVTPGVTAAMREKLSAVFTLVQEVNVLDSKDEANLALLARPELGITFTKLHCWRLTQYEKCVFVDADALVVRNCDELFERDEFSAAPDVGWPDCFNSGVFVYRPSAETFAALTSFAAAKGSFDGGDQGLLNQYFSDWSSKDIGKHLPFIYNMCSTATYSYLPAFKQFGDDVRIIHFIGSTKPWLQYFDTITGQVHPAPGTNHLQPLLQLWWNIFCDKVHPQLSPMMAGIAGALSKITLGEARSPEQIAFEEHMRKQSWEQGQIDYMGRDSFENIWKKITETLGTLPERQPSPPKAAPKAAETETDDSVDRPIVKDTVAKSEAAVLSELVRADGEDPSIGDLADVDDARKLISQLTELARGETTTIVGSSTVAPHYAALSKTVEEKIGERRMEVAEEALVCRKEVTEMRNLDTTSEGNVPIQVAESVLEADVKESVTEDLKPVSEEAISSISHEAQESVPAVLETALEAVDTVIPGTNGRIELSPGVGNGIDLHEIPSSAKSLASATVAVVEGISLPAETRLPVVEEAARHEDIAKESESPSREPAREVPEAAPSAGTASAPCRSRSPLKSPIASTSPSAVETVPTSETTITGAELPTCPRKSTEKTEAATVGREESCSAHSRSAVASLPAGLTDESIVKDEIPVDETVPERSEDKCVTKPDEKIPKVATDKREPDASILKNSALSAAKEDPKEPIGKVVPKKSIDKEAPKKSVDKEAAKKTVDKNTSKTQSDKKLTKTSVGKEVKKLPINKEVHETAVDKEVPKTPVDTEVVGLSSELPAATEDSGPLRPTRTKELQIPGTPTVTDATPPTSPPIGGAAPLDDQQQTSKTTKKTVKKVAKKTSETKPATDTTADPEAEVKKVTKKVVKKSTKKKEDEANSSTDTKKIVKTVKKATTKIQPQTLEVAEATAPETPPPVSAPEVPVPPKRKIKTSTKTISQKSDFEP